MRYKRKKMSGKRTSNIIAILMVILFCMLIILISGLIYKKMQSHPLNKFTEKVEEREDRKETPVMESVLGIENKQNVQPGIKPQFANTWEPGTVIDESQLDFTQLDYYFISNMIFENDDIYKRIIGKSYRENENISLDQLRYLKILHYNFEGNIQVGEMIVNQNINEDVLKIFEKLFKLKYRIQSIYLVDNYWTGNPDSTDSASIDVNNTSAFCYRKITGKKILSNHAYGRAIDLNPQQNPYVSYSSGEPKWTHSNADLYIERDTGLEHVITHGDPAFMVFADYGFEWGGDWSDPIDYQHFEKKESAQKSN